MLLHTGAAADDPEIGALLDRAAGLGAPLEEVGDRELRDFADTMHPQGIIAVAEIPDWGWHHVRAPRILVLDGVQDPGNVGTLIRTAEAMAAGAVVCLPGTADVWCPKAARASAGSCLRFPVLPLPWSEAGKVLQAEGLALWVADAGGEPMRKGECPPERLALILGNEGAGVSDGIRRDAHREVALDLAEQVESLNVAVAGAILMDRLFGGARDWDA